MKLTAVMNLVDHRASEIAAAAILAASNQRLTKKLMESKMSSISLCASLQSVSQRTFLISKVANFSLQDE